MYHVSTCWLWLSFFQYIKTISPNKRYKITIENIVNKNRYIFLKKFVKNFSKKLLRIIQKKFLQKLFFETFFQSVFTKFFERILPKYFENFFRITIFQKFLDKIIFLNIFIVFFQVKLAQFVGKSNFPGLFWVLRVEMWILKEELLQYLKVDSFPHFDGKAFENYRNS